MHLFLSVDLNSVGDFIKNEFAVMPIIVSRAHFTIIRI